MGAQRSEERSSSWASRSLLQKLVDDDDVDDVYYSSLMMMFGILPSIFLLYFYFLFFFRSISATLPMAEVALTSPLAREGAALRQQRVGAAWQKTIELLNNVDVSVAYK